MQDRIQAGATTIRAMRLVNRCWIKSSVSYGAVSCPHRSHPESPGQAEVSPPSVGYAVCSPMIGFAIIFTLLSAVSSLKASGFPKQPGEVTLILNHYRYLASRFWDNDLNLAALRFGTGRTAVATTKLFVEAGIDGNLTLFGSVPYATAVYEDAFSRADTRSFTDAEVGARYRIRRGPDAAYHLSIQGMVLVPLYRDGLNPVPGYRKPGLDARNYAGRGVMNWLVDLQFYSADTGFRLYPGSDILQWVYTLAGGLTLAPQWQLLYELSGTASRSSGNVFTPENILLNTDFFSHKAGIGLMWKPVDPQFGVIGTFYTDYAGRQSALGRAFNLSLLVFI